MIHALYKDGPRGGVQKCEQSEVPDSELPILGSDEPREEPIRVGGGWFELLNHSPRH